MYFACVGTCLWVCSENVEKQQASTFLKVVTLENLSSLVFIAYYIVPVLSNSGVQGEGR